MQKRAQERAGFGVKAKLVLLISLLCLAVGASLGGFFIEQEKLFLEEQFRNRGISAAKDLAIDSLYGLTTGDLTALQHLVKDKEREEDISYVLIIGSDQKVKAHTDPSEVGKVLSDELTKRDLAAREVLVTQATVKGVDLYDISFPILNRPAGSEDRHTSDQQRLGTARVGISLNAIREKIHSLIVLTIISVAVVVTLGIVISFFFLRMLVLPIERIAEVAGQISSGDFTQEITVASNDEIGTLGKAFGQMALNLKGMIRRIQEVSASMVAASEPMRFGTNKVSDGVAKQAKAAQETSASVQQFNAAIRRISENVDSLSQSADVTASSLIAMSVTVNEVASSSVSLASSVEDTSASLMEMSASIRNVVDNATQLSTASEETAASVNEMDASVKQIEQNAKQSAVLSERVSQEAKDFGVTSIEKTIAGMEQIRKTVDRSADVINKLGQKTEHIGKILTVIDEVTRQTNLLALNAAILAAQAGEQGKGFTVVADEIKNLADRTASSTKEISHLILAVQSESKDAVTSIREGIRSVEEGMKVSLEAKEALKKILESSQSSSRTCREIEKATNEQVRAIRQVSESTEKVNVMVQQIARAMQEQSHGTEQITRASENIRNTTRQVKSATEEQAKGAQQISASAENMSERIQQIAHDLQEQKKGSEAIMNSAAAVKQVAQLNGETVLEMNRFVEDLIRQAELLKGEVSKFKVA